MDFLRQKRRAPLNDWPLDVAALVDRLKLRKFSIMGISGGAPFAVATAAHFGDRVEVLGLISPLGPIADMRQNTVLSRLQRQLFFTFPAQPRLFAFATRLANASFRFCAGCELRFVCAHTTNSGSCDHASTSDKGAGD